jgi:hypothetical protein
MEQIGTSAIYSEKCEVQTASQQKMSLKDAVVPPRPTYVAGSVGKAVDTTNYSAISSDYVRFL